MKKLTGNHLRLVLFSIALALLVAIPLKAEALEVDVYSGHGAAGGGAPYSGLVGSFTSSDILFATNTGYAWHPFGLGDFGAEITGYLNVSADATYAFSLNSDDGSMLYIDANLVVNNGGAHGPQIVAGNTFLTAGLHPFYVQFYEDFGGPSGVDLSLPEGVSYASSVPEPMTLLLVGMSLLGIVGIKRRMK